MEAELIWLISAIFFLFTLTGILLAIHAVFHVNSPQATIAWCFSLVMFPYISVFLYLLIGHNKFYEYAKAHRQASVVIDGLSEEIKQHIQKHHGEMLGLESDLKKLFQRYRDIAFTKGNEISLLKNAKMAYPQMLKAIQEAKNYILLQSYIIRDDEVGNQFKEALIANKKIRVFVIYDEIGCYKLNQSFVQQLTDAGVQVSNFSTKKHKITNRFQINFRNHRKILIVDGLVGFMGGLNIGDEYLGRNPHFGYWRDTHLKITGPAVSYLQLPFVEDWYWANQQILSLDWPIVSDVPQNQGQELMILPHGPDDNYSRATLALTELIYHAKKRIWIASPYFVPDNTILRALVGASLRGVEVRILLPNRVDHLLVYLCSYSYYKELSHTDIKIYRYQKGFMHQKVWLIDNNFAAVGTTNLDNRSLLLNFEVMALSADDKFVEEVEAMLQADFKNSAIECLDNFNIKSGIFKLATRIARLFSPLL